MYDTTFDMAMSNAKKLGRCLGIMAWVLRYGELNDNAWKSLVRVYVDVEEEDRWNKDDLDYIREEAVRRGIDIGG
jgi:uncharacterized protein YdgA (DUF945 family)